MSTDILGPSTFECVLHSPWIDRLIEVFVLPPTQHIKQEDVAFGGLRREKVK